MAAKVKQAAKVLAARMAKQGNRTLKMVAPARPEDVRTAEGAGAALESSEWFQVDRGGLAKLFEARGKEWVVYELVQNAWDEETTRVDVGLEAVDAEYARLTVEDDSPRGFRDMRDAFTLFRPSYKKDNPELRGRFNVGEKLVLALCKLASVKSTGGTVTFDAKGRHFSAEERTAAGSRFEGLIRMRPEEVEAILKATAALIPPANRRTVVNGVEVPRPRSVLRFEATVPTHIGMEEGRLSSTSRRTAIELYACPAGEGMIYEMGLPVAETSMPWRVDVSQKVPLTLDRAATTQRFRRDLQTAVFNAACGLLTPEQMGEGWVMEAMAEETIGADAVETYLDSVYGKSRVVYDPTDPEAVATATAHGCRVISGNSLPKAAWAKVKEAGLALPAGKVYPTPRITAGGDGTTLGEDGAAAAALTLDEHPELAPWKRLAERIGETVLGFVPAVKFVKASSVAAVGWYGGREVTVNLAHLRVRPGALCEYVDLLLHEYAHERSGNHLDVAYHRALSEFGAKLALASAARPEVLALA